MREIPLTRGKIAIVDDQDFQWLNHWKWSCSGAYAHTQPHRGLVLSMHRLITGAKPGQVVHHINGNGIDNRRANLKVTIQSLHAKDHGVCGSPLGFLNAKKPTTRTSRYKGVCYKSRGHHQSAGWVASITHEGKWIFLGRFPTEDEARIAYNTKSLELRGFIPTPNL